MVISLIKLNTLLAIAWWSAMGSTACVRCGANLVPYSYCDLCHDVLCFTCSSCSMNTIERIHEYCNQTSIDNNNNIQNFLQMQNSSQIIYTTASLMMGINPQMEQVVSAQNMTANMTDSAGNSTGTNETGSISGLADL